MGGDDATLSFYTREAAPYADYAVTDEAERHMATFAAMLPPGGRVLDFGCGSGWAGARFRDMGYHVDGFDGSRGLAEQARARYGLDVTVGRFEDFAADDAYDGIWASFCLLHDRRAAMPGHLARLHRALRPGGALYLGLKEGTGENRDGLGRFYAYFGSEEIRALLAETGFVGTEIDHDEGVGYDGVAEPLLHIFARRG